MRFFANGKFLFNAAALVFGLWFITGLPAQSPENFQKYLEEAGYTDVTNIHKKTRACTKHSVNYAFTARDQQGRTVSAEACMAYKFVHSIVER